VTFVEKQSFIYIVRIEGNLAHESSLAKKRTNISEAQQTFAATDHHTYSL
jgi:hypothetical protein